MDEILTLPPVQDGAKARLDKYLSENIADVSRERLKTLILEGKVEIDGKTATSPSLKVTAGMEISVSIPPVEELNVAAQNIPLDILFEDDDLLVIDKPVGLTVHPAAGAPDGTLVNALLYHCKGRLSGINGVARPGIVHRLDKDTSGTMVIAKTDVAHQKLARQFEKRTLSRFYVALCYGVPSPSEGEIEGNIGRHPKNRKKMSVLAYGGKDALTVYQVLRRFHTDAALVQCKLHTGRTHQIRVHMAHIRHPLLGDPLYGRHRRLKHYDDEVNKAVQHLSGQMLHAAHLGFIHPTTGEEMVFETEVPETFQKALDLLQ